MRSRATLDLGIFLGTAPWVWLTLLPGREGTGALSLVPLADLLTMSSSQVIGNLLIFAVLGFLGPLRFRALASLPRVLACAGLASLLIETTQYLVLDRVASVDDVLLNTAGAGLAALVSRASWRGSAGEALSAVVPGDRG